MLINQIKRIRTQLYLIHNLFISNTLIGQDFVKQMNEANILGYKIKINFGHSNLHISLFEKYQKESVIDISFILSSITKKYSKISNEGIIELYGNTPIILNSNSKIFFNSRMTKEKYFHYSLDNDMPSYEHAQTAISMRKFLQKKYFNCKINLCEVDINKLIHTTIDVEKLQRAVINDRASQV